MGILDRFTSIVKANINELLDKAEDPEKMVDQYLREMTESLAEVREATAGVMAEEKRCKKLLDENREETEKHEELARKALAAGNEADARVFLAKKQELAGRAEGLTVAYEGAKANADKMRQMHDKLVADIEELNARKATIKAKAAVAKTQSKVNEMTSAGDRAEGARSAFDRMEAKADEMLDLGFLPDVQALLDRTPASRQTMMFSATMPAVIMSLASRSTSAPRAAMPRQPCRRPPSSSTRPMSSTSPR